MERTCGNCQNMSCIEPQQRGLPDIWGGCLIDGHIVCSEDCFKCRNWVQFKEEDKLIFLDIDGVLNSERFFVDNPPEITRSQIDSNAVKLLNQLTEAKVVVTSSWGEDGGRTTKALEAHGLKLPIVGYTKKVHYQFEWACRGNEIEEWIQSKYDGMCGTVWGDEYRNADYEYVIFDDDCDMLLGQKDHFIQVNRFTGLTQEDIDKAKKILNI